MLNLDDGDQVGGSLAELATIDIKMSQLVPLGTLVYQLTSRSHSPYALQVSCGIKGGVGRSR